MLDAKLKVLCEQSILLNVARENAMDYFVLADNLGSCELKRCAGDFIFQYMKDVKEEERD